MRTIKLAFRNPVNTYQWLLKAQNEHKATTEGTIHAQISKLARKIAFWSLTSDLRAPIHLSWNRCDWEKFVINHRCACASRKQDLQKLTSPPCTAGATKRVSYSLGNTARIDSRNVNCSRTLWMRNKIPLPSLATKKIWQKWRISDTMELKGHNHNLQCKSSCYHFDNFHRQ